MEKLHALALIVLILYKSELFRVYNNMQEGETKMVDY